MQSYGSVLARHASSALPDPEPREEMEFDVCIVGAGPAGLSAAIRLKQVTMRRIALLSAFHFVVTRSISS